MFIRSERLFLRPGWPEDREDLLRLMQGEQAAPRGIDCAWQRDCPDAAEPACGKDEPLLPRFLVTLPGAGGARVIGGAGLFRPGGDRGGDQRGDPGGDVHLACWIGRDHGGRGYGGEAVRALLSLARTLGHRRILANHVPGNAAVERLLAKAGFRATGRLAECAAAPGAGPAHEYELVFGPPSDCDDQPATPRHAA